MSDGQREPSLRDTITSAMDGVSSEAEPAASASASAEPKPAAVQGSPVADRPKVGAEGAAAPALTDPAKPADPATTAATTASGKPAADPNAPAAIPPAPPGFDLREWQATTDGTRQWIRNRETKFNQAWQKQAQQAKFGGAMWNAMRPYEATLRATGVNPVHLVDEFMATHDLLTRGSTEQKVQAVLRVCQRYGIDLAAAGQQTPEGAQAAPHPRIAQLEHAVQQMASLLRGREQAATQQEAQQIMSGLDTFAKNTEHEFFPHLWERMAELIETGAAKGRSNDEVLRSAYQTALWERGDIRAILTDRDAARRTREAQAARQASTAIGTSPVAGGTAIQSDSVRSAIEAAWDRAA